MSQMLLAKKYFIRFYKFKIDEKIIDIFSDRFFLNLSIIDLYLSISIPYLW